MSLLFVFIYNPLKNMEFFNINIYISYIYSLCLICCVKLSWGFYVINFSRLLLYMSVNFGLKILGKPKEKPKLKKSNILNENFNQICLVCSLWLFLRCCFCIKKLVFSLHLFRGFCVTLKIFTIIFFCYNTFAWFVIVRCCCFKRIKRFL